MATTTETVRVMLLPMNLFGDDTNIGSFLSLSAITTAATSGWFNAMYITPTMFAVQLPVPTVGSVVKGIRVELTTTASNDANLIATTLPALQTALNLTSPIITWSYVATEGY